MKAGKTLQALAAEIERQRNAKKDLIVSTDLMVMDVPLMPALAAKRAKKGAPAPEPVYGAPQLTIAGGTRQEMRFGINEIGHAQIAEQAGIPKKYYDRMRAEAPQMMANNVSEWFRKYPIPRLVRTLDGDVRAMLSDSYRPLEHADLAEAVLPVLSDLGVLIMSCEITERRLYIKAVDKRIERDVPTGRKMGDGSHCFFDTLSPAVVVSNSEVGLGQLSIESGVFTQVCTNLAAISGRGMKRRHVGQKHELFGGEAVRHLLSDETRKAGDRAVWMAVRDVTRAAFEEARFAAHCDQLAGLADLKLADPVACVELSAKHFDLSEGESKSVLRHLVEGGDLSGYGLLNAVTRSAQDCPNYDRATELEYLGGTLINLAVNDWKELARAA